MAFSIHLQIWRYYLSYLLLEAFRLGDSGWIVREEDVPLGVLVPEDLLLDEPTVDLAAVSFWAWDALSFFVVLGLKYNQEIISQKNNSLPVWEIEHK